MSDLAGKLEATVDHLKKEFQGLRTGRASAELLQPIMVDAYGQKTPLNQVGSISVLDARSLSVNIWDKSMVASVDKAIRDSGLGLNPVVDGQLLRIPMPELNEERRNELVKVARKYAEEARIAVRNVRRDAMDAIKRRQKDGEISEDDQKREETQVQKEIDDMIAKIDGVLTAKEADIRQV